MKVLMFGWEFPPHITGGLGTACYGLTKGLSHFKDLDLTFVVPKAYGDENKDVARIVGAEDVEVTSKRQQTKSKWSEHSESVVHKKEKTEHSQRFDETRVLEEINYIEIFSLLHPYLSPEEFDLFLQKKQLKRKDVVVDEYGRISYYENGKKKYVQVDETVYTEIEETGKISFSGKYGSNLMTEVRNYALVAASVASQQDFDLIHAHDWLTYLAGIAAKRISGKPLVIHVHATEFDRSGRNVNQVVYDIEKLGMMHADKIITVSNLTKQTVIQHYGIPESKIETVYNAVEQEQFMKSDYKKHVKEKIVTFLGRVTFQKGPEYFVEAAHKVLQKTRDVRFVMAGSGDMLRKMIKRAAELGITDRFYFTDFLKGEDVNRMFGMSDLYVMPSVSEPFGISPLEAMSSNVPVIISKQSGVAEILQHAIKIDFWDIDAMADAIYGLIKYDGLSEMFRKYGKTEVDNLKWENAAKHVKNIYHQMLAS